jgi:hypothetical protein
MIRFVVVFDNLGQAVTSSGQHLRLWGQNLAVHKKSSSATSGDCLRRPPNYTQLWTRSEGRLFLHLRITAFIHFAPWLHLRVFLQKPSWWFPPLQQCLIWVVCPKHQIGIISRWGATEDIAFKGVESFFVRRSSGRPWSRQAKTYSRTWDIVDVMLLQSELKFGVWRYTMPNTRRFVSEKPLSRYRRTHRPRTCTFADSCFTRMQPIRTAGYPRVLNRQRRARWHGWWLLTSLLKIAHCQCLHYCVGDGIKPARSNNSSRHDLSAMYSGVKSVVVWRSDAIPQVSMDEVYRYSTGIINEKIMNETSIFLTSSIHCLNIAF